LVSSLVLCNFCWSIYKVLVFDWFINILEFSIKRKKIINLLRAWLISDVVIICFVGPYNLCFRFLYWPITWNPILMDKFVPLWVFNLC
jgi:hypothetical protein